MEEVAFGLTLEEIRDCRTSLGRIPMLGLPSWAASDRVGYLPAVVAQTHCKKEGKG